jgi:hypothetical protein
MYSAREGSNFILKSNLTKYEFFEICQNWKKMAIITSVLRTMMKRRKVEVRGSLRKMRERGRKEERVAEVEEWEKTGAT